MSVGKLRFEGYKKALTDANMPIDEETQSLKEYKHFKDIMNSGTPIVMFDRVADGINCDKVVVDDFDSAYDATSHLIKIGSKKIALLSTIHNLSVGKLRFEGYQKALKDANMLIDEQLIIQESLSNALVFTRTKHGADNIVKVLKKAHIKAEAIHGDKSQNARQRVLEQFKNKEIDILVATDIAARGIDIEQLPFVINFDIPNISETYVHRIGRTGRAGNSGLAISFCGKDEKPYWQDIEKLIRMKVKVITDHPYEWKDEVKNPDAKPDLRNKNKINPDSKSRKSDASKKNKKRWC